MKNINKMRKTNHKKKYRKIKVNANITGQSLLWNGLSSVFYQPTDRRLSLILRRWFFSGLTSLPNVTQGHFKLGLTSIPQKNSQAPRHLPILATPQDPGNKSRFLSKERWGCHHVVWGVFIGMFFIPPVSTPYSNTESCSTIIAWAFISSTN